MRTARRISQILFLVFFVFLFLIARYPYQNWLPSDLFLRTDPLVGLASFITTRQIINSVLSSFVLLLLTIPFGRFFCGWMCPLGTCIDFSDNLTKRKRRKTRQREGTFFRSWKFAVLVGIIVASVFSFQVIWFFDPIALLTRTVTLVIYPVFTFITNGIFNFLFHIGWGEDQVYTVFDYAQKLVLPVSQSRFFQAGAVFVFFGIILALAMVTRRFWCRNLCPLGALLGLFSKYRITKRTVSEACTQCGLCQRDCKMNAIEDDYTVNSTIECIECAECVAVCPPQAVSYTIGKNRGDNRVDLSRRQMLQSALAGLAGLSLIKVAGVNKTAAGSLVRPPGSLTEDQFLDRCIRCHECSRICATTGGCLQPSATQGSVESFWTPVAISRNGYCEYSCNLCGQVCPTGAIQNLRLEKKQKLKMGLAFFDKNRCIPWYSQQDCLVCEEHCPTPEKAIKFDIREARTPDGNMRVVKFPYVVEDCCIGCGICENKCPIIGSPGIYVTNASEQRLTSDNLARIKWVNF